MPSPLLIDYLNRCKAVYQLQQHAPMTAAAEAARLHRVSPRCVAKSVLVRVDGELAMVVVPANYRVVLGSLRQALGASRIELARERQFQYRFPRCEPGAMPPFGHLFGFIAYAAPLFDTAHDILFKAGSHAESVRMPFAEFRRLAHFDPIGADAMELCREPSHPSRLCDVSPAVPLPLLRHRHAPAPRVALPAR